MILSALSLRRKLDEEESKNWCKNVEVKIAAAKKKIAEKIDFFERWGIPTNTWALVSPWANLYPNPTESPPTIHPIKFTFNGVKLDSKLTYLSPTLKPFENI